MEDSTSRIRPVRDVLPHAGADLYPWFVGDRLLILFPGALGDFICLWPTLRGLAATASHLTVVTRPSHFELLVGENVGGVSIDRREVSDLYARGEVASSTHELFCGHELVLAWSNADDPHFARRVAHACGGAAVRLFPFRGMRSGEHAAEYYARCARIRLESHPWTLPSAAERWANDYWRDHRLDGRALIVHPGSGSPRKNWEGMGDIVRWWRRDIGPVIALLGPVEVEQHLDVDADHSVRQESLTRIAALLRRGALYLGNDSGISHLAGIAGANGLALFGSSDPETWRPLGGRVRVLQRVTDCTLCNGRLCVHALPVELVRASLTATLTFLDRPSPRT